MELPLWVETKMSENNTYIYMEIEKRLRHGSLFSGIGGFDLAAEWMGWENAFHCEWDDFGTKVLNYYWPNAKSYGDITKTDFMEWRGRIDILTGGFPCQPFSMAGKRKGKEDDRYLWPEMLRAIREIQPTWVIGENVGGIISMVQPCDEVEVGGQASLLEEDYFTQKDQEYVVETVCSNLEREGYSVQPFLIPACAIGAPHRRDRVWFVAKNTKCDGRLCGEFEQEGAENGKFGDFGTRDCNGICEQKNAWNSKQNGWGNFPTQPPIRERNDGISIRMVKYVTKELQYEISNTSQENRIENLHEVRERISQKEIWEQVRRFYSLESKEVLLQTMQLYSREYIEQIELSPFSEDFSKIILQHLRKYGEFRYSPQGQELQKQRPEQLRNSLSFLPHEVALAARRFEAAITKFENWHRNESIKAYGNAIVPQVAYQIFEAINQFELK